MVSSVRAKFASSLGKLYYDDDMRSSVADFICKELFGSPPRLTSVMLVTCIIYDVDDVDFDVCMVLPQRRPRSKKSGNKSHTHTVSSPASSIVRSRAV
jgi:hypothetical protein